LQDAGASRQAFPRRAWEREQKLPRFARARSTSKYILKPKSVVLMPETFRPPVVLKKKSKKTKNKKTKNKKQKTKRVKEINNKGL